MLENIAQKVAVSTSKIIGYDVIIMNEDSIIIGSSDSSRIGGLHEASINIMDTGNPNPSSVNIELLQGTKPGYALPIKISGENVGSFGITGEREEVKGYCYLLKEYIETMLYQEMYIRSQMLHEKDVENLLKEITVMPADESNEQYLRIRGEELGYNLNLPRMVITINFFEKLTKEKEFFHESNEKQLTQIKKISFNRELIRAIKTIFSNVEDIIIPFQKNQLILIPFIDVTYKDFKKRGEGPSKIKEKCKKIQDLFQKKELDTTIGLGSISEKNVELRDSLHAARRALHLGEKLNETSRVHYIHDLLLENLSTFAINSYSSNYMHFLLCTLDEQTDAKELKDTICCWCESSFSKKKTAEYLYIHRNTLQYRLNKIKKISGIDPNDFRQIMSLYLSIIMEKMN